MIHLLLGIPADSVRQSPFIPVVNQPEGIPARELGLNFCPDAVVDCLPGVASYVGSDITAGVLSSGIGQAEETTLFIDVGTNGEIVLGNQDWLMTCACSAGPAFEGAGVKDGMRATTGAIEEVWINDRTLEPSLRVIGDCLQSGDCQPSGICGSGLIDLLGEMFLTGILDKAGRINLSLPTRRVRQNEQGGGEYVLAWGSETAHGEDIVLTRVDVDNLLRAKAAIYAGFEVLAEKVGFPLADVQQMLIGGSFGKYINVEKAVLIGLLPDMAWDRFTYLGNTSAKGAYMALLDARSRAAIQDIASRMTYVELSADNMFYEAFTSALFLPNTDLSKFPSVRRALSPHEGHPGKKPEPGDNQTNEEEKHVHHRREYSYRVGESQGSAWLSATRNSSWTWPRGRWKRGPRRLTSTWARARRTGPRFSPGLSKRLKKWSTCRFQSTPPTWTAWKRL